MAKMKKAAMMAGVACKMKKLVLNAGLLEKGSFCFRECSYDVPVNALGCSVRGFGCAICPRTTALAKRAPSHLPNSRT